MVGRPPRRGQGSPLNPNTHPDRIPALDLLRGVAVLGILLLNIVSFAMPEAAYLNPRAYGGWHGADLAVYLVNFVLFDGKMRGLFSVLFGASLLLIAARAEAAGANPASRHYRRMAWLLVFGLAHLILVWSGDILVHYALIGCIAFALRGLPAERLLILGAMLVAASLLLFGTLPFAVWQMQQPGAIATAADLKEWQALAAGFGDGPSAETAREVALHRGGYAGLLAARAIRALPDTGSTLLLVGPETLGYMLFGMWGLRSGMLTGGWPRARYRRWLAWSVGLILPIQLGLAAMMVSARFSILLVAIGVIAVPALTRPPMIAGWACAILLLMRPGGWLTRHLAAAGRMAFSNYLLTSLACTTLFYGHGLGWYGALSRWQLYPIVFALWLAMMLGSRAWLARFRFGPFEWLWRSLVEWRAQPMVCRAR